MAPRSEISPSPLLFTTYFPKLSETFISGQVRSLARRGLQPRVMSLLESPDADVLGEVDRGTGTEYLNSRPVAPLESSEGYADLPHWASTLLLSQTAAFYNVNTIIQTLLRIMPTRYPVLHVHYLTPPGTIGALLQEKRSIPSLIELHGYDIFRIGRNYSAMAAQVLCRYDRIIVNSHYMKSVVQTLMPDGQAQKITVLPPGIDFGKLGDLARPNQQTGDNRFKIVSVGRLVEKKGLRFLLDALTEPSEFREHFLLEIVGAGPDEEMLKKQVHLHGLQNQVTFLGPLSNELALEKIRQADLFVLPCVEAKNGDLDSTPNALMEAQALGIPVISSSISGIPEIVDNGVTGTLVYPKDVVGLRDAIERLFKDPNLRAAMSEAATRFARERFDLDVRSARLCDIYDDLLGHDRGLIT